MSAAAAADAPPPKGNKKLIIILAVVLLLVLGGGGAAFMMMKKKHADEEEDGGGGEHAAAKVEKPKPRDPKTPPTFVPLDPFVVNLADRDAERYAQIGVTLEIDDPKVAEELKAYMPAIRNNILMVLSAKTAHELLERDGKERLASDILREAVRPLGIELDDESEEEGADGKPKKKKKKRAPVYVPVTQVYFSNFIIQ